MKTLSLRAKLACMRLLFLTYGLLKLIYGVNVSYSYLFYKPTGAQQYLIIACFDYVDD